MTFRRISLPALVALFVLSLSSTPVLAINGEYDLAFNSAYIWRGLTVVDGAVFQPSITLSHDSGFSINTWGNLDISDVNDHSGQFTELDLTADYTLPLEGLVGVNVGLINYNFPNYGGTDDSTNELYAGLSFDVVASPFVTIYYDFDAVQDFYINFGVGHEGEFSEDVSWSTALSMGFVGSDFSAYYSGGDGSGFHEWDLSFGVGYTFPDTAWSIGGFVAYVDSLDKDVLPEQDTNFYGGVSFTGSF